MKEIQVNRNLYIQPWRDEAGDLGQFTERQAARVEAALVDVRGGRGESRLEAVRRKHRETFH